MTIRLFDKDAYATKFRAKVVSCEANEKQGFDVKLEQTLFFPEEGGQSPDKGILGGSKVLDVQVCQEEIVHTVDAPLAVGEEVDGEIDWKHRFSNMQQHSGEHLFSGIVYREYGFHNVGFHLSDQIVTMDFDGVLSEEDVAKVEWKVNEAIVSNALILVTFPKEEELASLDYRSKKEIEGQVRIVTIEGYDVCACCAPHVNRTGEIGMLKVVSVQNYKGGVRISMLCGFRALLAYREKAEVISQLTGMLTTGQELLADSVSKLRLSLQNANGQLRNAKEALLSLKVKTIAPEEKNILIFEDELDLSSTRTMLNHEITLREGICACFSGNDKKGYSYVIASKNVDCMILAGKLRQEFEAKGGGNATMIQGSVCAKKEVIEQFLLQETSTLQTLV